jgi:hypothetical protein
MKLVNVSFGSDTHCTLKHIFPNIRFVAFLPATLHVHDQELCYCLDPSDLAFKPCSKGRWATCMRVGGPSSGSPCVDASTKMLIGLQLLVFIGLRG